MAELRCLDSQIQVQTWVQSCPGESCQVQGLNWIIPEQVRPQAGRNSYRWICWGKGTWNFLEVETPCYTWHIRPGTAIPCLELGIAPAAQINCCYSSREPKERQSYQMFACFNKKPLVTAHMGGVYITFLSLLLGNTLHCVLLNLKKNHLTSASFLSGKTKQEKLVRKDNPACGKSRVSRVGDGKPSCALVHVQGLHSTRTVLPGINPAVHRAWGMHLQPCESKTSGS